MATQLAIYNGALVELGEGTLTSTTEDNVARYKLDVVYSDVVTECLEAGPWNFAMRTVKLDADTSITPNFGYTEVFAKPTDWLRTHGISENPDIQPPLLQYYDDVDYFSANVTPIYLRYVSNSASWGLDLTLWPRSFTRYVEVALADRACMQITQSDTRKDKLERYTLPRAKRNALNKDAMNEATKFLPAGTWNSSRGGSGGDRGNRNSLIG